MQFSIVTDATANLYPAQIEARHITVIPFPYFENGEPRSSTDMDSFDEVAFYGAIRNGMTVTTSQINPQQYMMAMEPLLAAGEDILFVGLSSGVSGSFASASLAADSLRKLYPDRHIVLIDSLGAGCGQGLVVMHAADCRDRGMSLEESESYLNEMRKRLCQIFFVGDLMHLKRTGRLSGAGALIGTMLGIKPLLKGDEQGKIVPAKKVRGRKQAIIALSERYAELVKNAADQTVYISHCDCPEDARFLAALLRGKQAPKDVIICKHEPSTGSHLGPDSLALFFEGDEEVRLH